MSIFDDTLDSNTISNLVLTYIKNKGILGDGVNFQPNAKFAGFLDENLNKTEFDPSDIDSYYVYYSKKDEDEIYLIKYPILFSYTNNPVSLVPTHRRPLLSSARDRMEEEGSSPS